MAKSKYNPDTFPALAEKNARDGMLDKENAKALGISKESFYKYAKEFPDFADAIKEGKKPVNAVIEKTAIEVSLGGIEVKEVHTEVMYGVDGLETGRKVKTVVKKTLPSESLLKFMLMNRLPDQYKIRKWHEFSPEGLSVTFDKTDQAL